MRSGLNDPAKIKSFKLSIPFVGDVEWEPNPVQRNAAWALYVELVTRVSLQDLDMDQGVLREALSSLYSLFQTTRQILREAGPDVGAAHDTVGGIAIAVLNQGVRSFLTKWHPRLLAHEAGRASSKPPQEWEREWSEEPRARGELRALTEKLQAYAATLAKMAGVRS
jgi:hypothetical protein